MSTYNKKFDPIFNQIKQEKSRYGTVSSETWNTLFNTLAEQTNKTAEQVKALHDFVSGGNNVDEEIEYSEDAADLIHYIERKVRTAGIYTGANEPEDKFPGMLWVDTSGED